MTSPLRSIIKHHAVRLDVEPGHDAPTGPAAAVAAKARAPRHGQKKVELVRADGKVRALEITCACGEKTVVELDYADDKPADEKPKEKK
ncbi:MAG: hypothetical protein L6Q99_03215 [Planctomycetes bacterium]|nr:hypothetical protein [Planctomycetota bacterium]